jgi:glycosyltransferase involved in cell wall biosynthesis
MENQKYPLISVIIPCYNYGLYLGACIDSIIAQTYQNWECLIIDDGSSDNSIEVAKQYSDTDFRVKFFMQKNAGPTVARNLGLKHCIGQYVQFLDADDLLQNKKFEIQLNIFLNNPLTDIVYSKAKYFALENPFQLYDHLDLKSVSELKSITGNGDVIITELLKGNIMVISAPLIKKTVFDIHGLFDETLYYNEDWELWTRLALANCTFLADDTDNTKPLIRVHNSYSKDNFNMFVYGLMVCLKINKHLHVRKYKKIMMPKIAYHQKMIDEKLLGYLKVDANIAIEKSNFVYNKTKLKRYDLYSRLFKCQSHSISKVLSLAICSALKLKNLIVYA